LDISSWKIPTESTWLINISVNQEALTYSLELIYSTRCFNQADENALETIQYFKKQFLAGQLLVEPQQTQP
jgi:hypothetical protein